MFVCANEGRRVKFVRVIKTEIFSACRFDVTNLKVVINRAAPDIMPFAPLIVRRLIATGRGYRRSL
jgi:hypothetical protein